MKKILLVAFCLVLVPAVSFAGDLACGKNYNTTFKTDLADASIKGIMGFACNDFSQGAIGIEYDNGDIGTGAYTNSSAIALSGQIDLYDPDSNYYIFSFEGTTLGCIIFGSGTITQPSTGDTGTGSFFGIKAR